MRLICLWNKGDVGAEGSKPDRSCSEGNLVLQEVYLQPCRSEGISLLFRQCPGC